MSHIIIPGIKKLHEIIPLIKIQNSSSACLFGIPILCIQCKTKCYKSEGCSKNICSDCMPLYIKKAEMIIFQTIKETIYIFSQLSSTETITEDVKHEILLNLMNLDYIDTNFDDSYHYYSNIVS